VKLKLHPSAAQRINERGAALRNSLTRIDRERLRLPHERFPIDTLPRANITSDQILQIWSVDVVDPLSGRRVQCLFDDGKHAFMLDEHGCDVLSALSQAVAKERTFGQYVGRERVDEEIKRWLDPSNQTPLSLSQWLLSEIDQTIKLYSVWVPVANLYIESEFAFGDVTFRPITKAFMDQWADTLQWDSLEDKQDAERRFTELRESCQGLAAATLDIEAEPTRVRERATETADRAVALLRTFCPENHHPAACSYCVPLGRLTSTNEHVWLVDVPNYIRCERAEPPFPNPWELSDQERLGLNQFGFAELAGLAQSRAGTEFDRKLVEALLIYNRANVSRDPVDKLIYILVSLESLLLKSTSEPVQTAICDRMPFVVGKDADERRQIAALVRQCYKVRSRYIHHGRSDESLGELERFLMYAWVFFSRLIRTHRAYRTKDELLEQLDRRKYT